MAVDCQLMMKPLNNKSIHIAGLLKFLATQEILSSRIAKHGISLTSRVLQR